MILVSTFIKNSNDIKQV